VSRDIDERELCHERLGRRFELQMSRYDLDRRLEVLIDDFLGEVEVAGLEALDVGCGLGAFSERLSERGARVTALDIGAGLVAKAVGRARCEGVVGDACRLIERFGSARFDLVLSSECIEHTAEPRRAVAEMIGVLKPAGRLSLSTPNWLWQPVVRCASRLKLRPYDGYENFLGRRELRGLIEAAGGEVIRHTGLHLIPFQMPLHRLSKLCDRRLQSLAPLMINQCMLASKR
jgi:2-polyprenyl-3-methyl-5-hydroxy-6-metoxy-1,4-benzoquinol methylase